MKSSNPVLILAMQLKAPGMRLRSFIEIFTCSFGTWCPHHMLKLRTNTPFPFILRRSLAVRLPMANPHEIFQKSAAPYSIVTHTRGALKTSPIPSLSPTSLLLFTLYSYTYFYSQPLDGNHISPPICEACAQLSPCAL